MGGVVIAPASPGEGAPSSDASHANFPAVVLDHVETPIFVKDRAFRLVLVNDALCALTGRRREEMLGRTDDDLSPGEDARRFRASDEAVFATGRPVVIEEETVTLDNGRRVVLATHKAPLRGPEGAPTHIVGAVYDITARKAAEDALREAKATLEARVEERAAELRAVQEDLMRAERLAVLGRLAGGLAHQIRTPLATIRNTGWLIRRFVAMPGAQADLTTSLDILEQEIDRANAIITDLLEYARMKPPSREEVGVGELVGEALAERPPPGTVVIERAIDPSFAIFVDRGQLRNVLFNLVQNAVDAMPGGGTLSFSASLADAEVVLVVRDTGAGIDAAILPKLFEPLVTSKSGGLGLGLSTARALVENQGGSLTCESGLGAGAAFVLRLPSRRPPEAR